MNFFKSKAPLSLESGATLSAFELAYHTYGTLNASGSNVIWVCHALTANSDPAEWWPGLVGPDLLIDPNKYFIVCVNMIGSCYGSTGPTSINPSSGRIYGKEFPLITIRDVASAYKQLADHLGINQIFLSLGGSTGGMQVMEWAIMEPDRFENIGLIACNAKHSPWGIAFNESQRMAILADPTIHEEGAHAGA
ncbi:MAG: alpha/beta fold hydrolase, partial [Saprospiraceae bacterium]|nr:alpha/beta fold hydrolase [Saprospiraceae bacterium]